ncbi:MAG: cysteine--tRNA ligase [Gemmatimonadales bacterium]|nr:cysteine--tRNA ligase [Gemmatimonadales bacterium]MBP9198672.1 cysteine--tRNA ligase [Gemmatimonadales bacterium]
MSLHLYNTLTRAVEPFAPQVPGRVSMYTCGPTIWNYAHIGNFRTFLFEDLLRRWLEACGLRVFHVMNLTDVDDRIIKEAGARGVPIRDFTEPFARAFFEDRDFLRIRPAHEYPRATDYVPAMIGLVEGLLAKGVAYQGDDGSVYFAIQRFPAYGQLSQLDRRSLKAGASGRVSTDEYDKENAQDFVLWKAARPEDEAVAAAWDAPFGRGRPGWHLECSAMALALLAREGLGTVLDIHAGGVDLIFPHHEDEIAQSCAFTGERHFARVWMHGEFLNVRGTKMSKRFGNITTPRDLKADGVDAGALRLLVFQTHYRQKLDLTDEGLAAAREGSRRLGEFDARLGRAAGGPPEAGAAWRPWAERLAREVRAALDDDLNAPQAIAALFEALREGNRLLDQGIPTIPEARAAWDGAMTVLDVLPASGAGGTTVASGVEGEEGSALAEGPPAEPAAVEPWALAWARRRLAAKTRKDYKEADRIRDLLKAAGWQIRDNKDGTVEVRRG